MTEPYGYDENDTDDSYDDGGSDERYVRLKRDQIRTLERDAKQAREANERAAAAERRLAILEAGVGSLTERQQKALFSSIDGDVTGEALRQAAEELGFVQATPDASNDEAEALNRMSQASAGAADPGSEDSIARLERVAREGGREALLAQIQADGHLVTPAG